MTEQRIEATKTIPASAATIFAVLTDPKAHVDIDGSGMLQHVNDGPRVTKAGDTFSMHMDGRARAGAPQQEYDIVVHIVKFVPDEEIAWTVGVQDKPVMGHVFGYSLLPSAADETVVTSYHDWSTINPENKMATRMKDRFPIMDEAVLVATLDRLANVVRARR